MPTPVLHLSAGPNGAGKTTFYDRLLGPTTGLELINADRIAAERWPRAPCEHAYDAARVAARQREERIAAGRSFATETVFSHPSKTELVHTAVQAGFRVILHVVAVPEQLAVARVANRVEHGGHPVPEDKIRSRYRRLFDHVADAVALAGTAKVYDNTRLRRPFVLVATFVDGRLLDEPNWPAWMPTALRQTGS